METNPSLLIPMLRLLSFERQDDGDQALAHAGEQMRASTVPVDVRADALLAACQSASHDERVVGGAEMFAVGIADLGSPEARNAGERVLKWCALRGSLSAAFNLIISKTKGEPPIAVQTTVSALTALLEMIGDHRELRGRVHDALGLYLEDSHSALSQWHYEESARLGCARGAFNSGVYYDKLRRGEDGSLQPDYEKAARFYQMGCERDVRCKTNLGLLVFAGRVPGGDALAYRLLTEASEAGDQEAVKGLALFGYAP